jgi:hypothetical protein
MILKWSLKIYGVILWISFISLRKVIYYHRWIYDAFLLNVRDVSSCIVANGLPIEPTIWGAFTYSVV